MNLNSVRAFSLEDVASAPWLPAEALAVLAHLKLQSGIWTGRMNGEIVAVCGVTQLNEYVAEAWTFLHPTALTAPYWLFRATKSILACYVDACGFWRVQALVEETQRPAQNWIEHLGFDLESRMPLAGPKGETVLRYVWFPKGLNG